MCWCVGMYACTCGCLKVCAHADMLACQRVTRSSQEMVQKVHSRMAFSELLFHQRQKARSVLALQRECNELQTFVWLVRGMCREKKSPWARASLRVTSRTPMAAALASDAKGSCAMMVMPRPRARLATSLPTCTSIQMRLSSLLCRSHQLTHQWYDSRPQCHFILTDPN